MATRMQQRRGTAAQWTSANPILNAGEMGWESDTNKFKIGDGTNHWADIDYFIDQSSTVNPAFGSSITFEGATANDYETTLAVTDPTADRTITLPNATGTVVLADGSGNVTVSGNLTVQGTTTTIDSSTIAVTNSFTFEGATANDYETTLTVTDPTADRTITLPNVSGTVITTGNLGDTGATSTELGYLTGVTSAIQTQLNNKQAVVTDVSDTEIGYLNGVTSAIQTQLNDKAPKANPTFTGTVSLPSGTSIGDLSSTEIGYLEGVSAGIQGQIDGKSATGHTHTLSAGATDVTASASEVNLIDGSIAATIVNSKAVIYGPAGEVNATTLQIGGSSITATVAEINKLAGLLPTQTELNYVDGVTSAIQTQIDGKAASSHTHAQSDITNLTTDLAAKAALSGATFTGAVVLHADPATALGAATKQYVDSVAEGLHVHASVVAATTANVTLSSALENGDTLDGVTLATGNRILVKNQTTKSENGIYIVAASGAPSRAADFDSPAEIDGGDFVFVTGGTTNDNTGWVQTNIVGTIGTDAIEFSQFAGAGVVTAGTNVSVTGNQVSVINNPTFSGLVTATAAGVAFSDGTQTKEGVPSKTSIIQKTAEYTLSSLTERDSLIEVSHTGGTAVKLLIPTDATLNYPIGTSIDVLRTNTGAVTIEAVTPGTTTVNATPGLKLRAQWSSATLFKRAANLWVVMGDLSA
jgi:hypothetical protein